MNEGIQRLEYYPQTEDIDVNELLQQYKKLYTERPVWQFIEDIQRQAMIYANIVELLKSGKTAEEIRGTMENLDLVPEGVLPNPNMSALLTRAFDKLSQYRRALVEIVKRFGGELLMELSFEVGLTVSVGVDIGLPPAVTIAVEHESVTQAQTVWQPSKQVGG